MTTTNVHQLCFSTKDEIIKISMMANTVEDPNQLLPNLTAKLMLFMHSFGNYLIKGFQKVFKIVIHPTKTKNPESKPDLNKKI